MNRHTVTVFGAVEGIVDEAVLRRILNEVGAIPGTIYGRNGKKQLLKKLPAYNYAARINPWGILIDLDQDAECAAVYRAVCLPELAPYMCFRVVVREIESWLLADSENIAKFLGVNIVHVPDNPEALVNAKQEMVNLARRSRRKDIRDDMVPTAQARGTTGPAYASRLIEFVEFTEDRWRPEVAATSCDSLARCLNRLTNLIDNFEETS